MSETCKHNWIESREYTTSAWPRCVEVCEHCKQRQLGRYVNGSPFPEDDSQNGLEVTCGHGIEQEEGLSIDVDYFAEKLRTTHRVEFQKLLNSILDESLKQSRGIDLETQP